VGDGDIFPGLYRPGRGADQLPLSGAEMKNVWSYISTPPYVFITWRLIKHSKFLLLRVLYLLVYNALWTVEKSADVSEKYVIFEASVDFRQTMGRYIPEDKILHNHRCDNLKSYNFNFIFVPLS
jgi:hypothetical protein